MYITAVTTQGQIAEFAAAMDAIGVAHERGVTFALNGVAKDAKARLIKVLEKTIDQPTPFTLKAIANSFAKLGSTNDLRDLESTVYVKDDQSAYLKYLRGTGVNVRKPGDIGPADEHIYQPIWQNLERIEGIKPIYGQGLPRNTLRGLMRRAGRTAVSTHSRLTSSTSPSRVRLTSPPACSISTSCRGRASCAQPTPSPASCSRRSPLVERRS